MARSKWTWMTCKIVLLASLIALPGCGDDTVSLSSPMTDVRIWIDDGPDKPSTRIVISISEPMEISLTILGPEGELVRVLMNGHVEAGTAYIIWNGTDDANEAVASGAYWAFLVAENQQEARAMMLIK